MAVPSFPQLTRAHYDAPVFDEGGLPVHSPVEIRNHILSRQYSTVSPSPLLPLFALVVVSFPLIGTNENGFVFTPRQSDPLFPAPGSIGS